MPTPSIQTLTTDAQQVLNLDSISAVRSVVAVALANANTGTPLNPNLTTQQLWDQFYQVVTRPKSDIESIIANQLMKFLYSPPAPGGAGADKQVIFNDGGVLAGDADFLWNKTTNLLTVTGAATITGDLTVRTNKLYVTATGVGCGMTPITPLSVSGAGGIILFRTTDPSAPVASPYLIAPVSTGFSSTSPVYGYWYQSSGIGNPAVDTVSVITASSERYRIAADGVATWSNVGGVAGTAMTLNSTGLGIGLAPVGGVKLSVAGTIYANAGNALILDNPSSNFVAQIKNTGSSLQSTLAFLTGSGTSMLIDNSGNVGVGVTPSAKLDVSANDGTMAIFRSSGGSSNDKRLTISTGGAKVVFNISDNSNTATARAYEFQTAGSAAMTLDASGNLLVGVTSANASGGCLQLKSGITFPATQVASSDANTLDDYEEGTFTPAITGSTTAGTATYVGRSGKYTKIGNLVQVQIFIDYNSHTGTGDTRITGLPFTNGANFSAATVGYANGLALTAGYYVQAYVDASQSFILLNQAPTGGGSNTTVPIDPAATLVITATYTV